ncbi:multiple sugar transport system permease protein [Arcanobacterium pluranimalium]|uniref:carbohydrate ABC transporter permease n=1 Tax=Arcanobacterium pluranimalium TaxID=108028 RepID=UPI001EF8910C|nr:sugar ABC transporter permease [Arcanobacterium pluranimalium]MBM7824389.1 multiple sugar transport system permease protein [Arcanobacterium pluranimalium]
MAKYFSRTKPAHTSPGQASTWHVHSLNGTPQDASDSPASVPASAQNRSRTSARKAEIRTAYTMLLPSFIGVGLFLIVPVFAVLVLSFTEWNLISPPHWVGFDNYISISSDPEFWRSIFTTAVFSVLAIPGAIVCGLLIALGLNRRLPGSRFLQLCFVLPWIAAPLSLGIVWSWLLAPRTGLINNVLGTTTAWMSNESTALPVVAFVYIWQNVGYISLFFLAALQAIPASIYEAAVLDGAGAVRRLFSITLPLIRPTTFFVLVTSLIGSFQVYDLVFGLTGGNPGYPGGTTDVIAARIYSAAFTSPQIGQAATMAVLLTIVVVLITVAQQRYFRTRITYEMSDER